MIEATEAPPTEAAKSATVWEDFIDIFYVPSQVFARRALSSPWLPMAVVTAAMAVLVYVNSGLLEPMMSAEFDRSIAATLRSNPSITPEAVANMRRMGLSIGQFGGIFTPVAI